MTLQETRDQKTWDQLASSVEHATFLQSWGWGEAQAALGKRVVRYMIEDKDGARFLAQAYEEKRRGVSYWFVPGGPIEVGRQEAGGRRQDEGTERWERAVDILKRRLLKGRAVFLRIEPLFLSERLLAYSPTRLLSWIPTSSFNPAIHWMVDLRGKTEEQLLSEMEQKTRYNVRLGQKHHVTTRVSTDESDFEVFLALMKETGVRNKMTPHGSTYLSKTFFAMAELGIAQLRLAEYEGKVVAASIEVSFGDTVTYLHGASSTASRETKAPNLLQWEAMRAALSAGYAWYDFGGCNPVDANHFLYKKSLEGVTRFKEGWGGGRIEFAGTFVVPRWSWMRSFFKSRT